MKRLQIPEKLVFENFLRTRNWRRKFIENLLPEKRKENMETKQLRFKSWLNYSFFIRTSKFYMRLAVLNFFFFIFEAEMFLICSYFPEWTL